MLEKKTMSKGTYLKLSVSPIKDLLKILTTALILCKVQFFWKDHKNLIFMVAISVLKNNLIRL